MESRGRGSRNNSAGVTLNTMLSDKRGPIRPGDEQFPRVHSNRTLSDIIRDESSGTNHYYTGKKSWRHFKDKLRRRRGAAWTSTFSTPTSDIPINNRSMNRRPSGGFPSDSAHPVDIAAVPDVDPELMLNSRNKPSLQRNSSRAMERASGRPLGLRRLQREDNGSEDDDDDDDNEEERGREEGESGSEEEEEEEEEASGEGHQPVRMSLMSLLAETDREMGLDGSSYMLDEEDEEEDEDGEGDDGEYNNCCVCMVRHKGTAFVPCGHSFCRLCSKELWAQRGNCPLCNNYILEILDIF